MRRKVVDVRDAPPHGPNSNGDDRPDDDGFGGGLVSAILFASSMWTAARSIFPHTSCMNWMPMVGLRAVNTRNTPPRRFAHYFDRSMSQRISGPTRSNVKLSCLRAEPWHRIFPRWQGVRPNDADPFDLLWSSCI